MAQETDGVVAKEKQISFCCQDSFKGEFGALNSLVRDVGLGCGVDAIIKGSTSQFKDVWVVADKKAQCLNPLVTHVEGVDFAS